MKTARILCWLAFAVCSMLIAGADSGSASRSTTTVSLLEISSEQFHLGHTHSHWTENGAAFTASRSNLVECRRGNENIPRPLWENYLANDAFRTENRPSNLISYIQPGPRRKCAARRLHFLSRLNI
ncbi:hypothetical protein [Rikenella microfusus]|uniref:hypothetical protein n=1 Tax=Rikenella microfusus TaxID=28139 RepID=UPI003A935ADA